MRPVQPGAHRGPVDLPPNLPVVATREEWLSARAELLAEEKALTECRSRRPAARSTTPDVSS